MTSDGGSGGSTGPARLLDEAAALLARAAGKVLSDPVGQEALARAVGLAQIGLQRVEALQAELFKVAGVPGRRDYDDLAKQLARLKRKARELDRKLAARGAAGPGGAGPDGARNP
jgi:hypothetical protein